MFYILYKCTFTLCYYILIGFQWNVLHVISIYSISKWRIFVLSCVLHMCVQLCIYDSDIYCNSQISKKENGEHLFEIIFQLNGCKMLECLLIERYSILFILATMGAIAMQLTEITSNHLICKFNEFRFSSFKIYLKCTRMIFIEIHVYMGNVYSNK